MSLLVKSKEVLLKMEIKIDIPQDIMLDRKRLKSVQQGILKVITMIYNSVLKNLSEVNYAIDRLDALGVFAHPDKVKSWDTYKMVDIINKADRSSFILDVGCNGSPILSILKRLGFQNLYGCDLFLK